jgi:hypothetical protein
LRGEYYTKYQSEQLFETALTKAQQKIRKLLEAKIKIKDLLKRLRTIKFIKMLLSGVLNFQRY